MKKTFLKFKELSNSQNKIGKGKDTSINTAAELRSYVEKLKITHEKQKYSREDLRSDVDKITRNIRKGKYKVSEQDQKELDNCIKGYEVAYTNYKFAKRSWRDSSSLKKSLDDATQNYLHYLLEKIDSASLQITTIEINAEDVTKQKNPENTDNLELDDKTKLEILKDADAGEKIVPGGGSVGSNNPNQDAFFVDKAKESYAVFDGVGGASYGDIASATARDVIQSQLADFPDNINDAKREMRRILLDAHKAIDQLKLEGAQATTASVVKILKDRIGVIGNMGDSRVYVLRKGSNVLEHLTLDNARGSHFLKSNPAYPHMQTSWDTQKRIANLDSFEKNVPRDLRYPITIRAYVDNALGGKPDEGKKPDPAIYINQFQPGDRLVLSSDGIHDNLTDKQIAECLLKNPSNDQKAADDMIEAATQVMNQYDKQKGKWQRSKKDDRTAVVVEIE